jgi:hypothetical protein
MAALKRTQDRLEPLRGLMAGAPVPASRPIGECRRRPDRRCHIRELGQRSISVDGSCVWIHDDTLPQPHTSILQGDGSRSSVGEWVYAYASHKAVSPTGVVCGNYILW